MELFHAHRQWATRPADQRFESLEQIYHITKAYHGTAREKTVPWPELRAVAAGEDVRLVGPAGTPAALTHFAFGQVCQRAKAPASYLRTLPAEMAATNLNYGLNKYRADDTAQLLIHKNGDLLVRAATTERYERLWNYEVAERLIDVADRCALVPARQTFTWSGDDVAEDRPAALYASDHDLWTFLMTEARVLEDPINKTPMYRGLITWNSEVGAASLGLMGFYFNEICGNHIIWGARDVTELRLRHIGDVRGKWREAQVEMKRYLDRKVGDEQALLIAKTTHRIAGTKTEVLDTLFGKRSLGLSRKTLEAGYDAVQPEQDGEPNTVWGMVQGLTRYSQTLPYADERQPVDRAAGRLLSLTF